MDSEMTSEIIDKKCMEVLLKSQQGELDAVPMYNALAKVVRDEKDSATFKQLSAEEGHHASIFKNLTKNDSLKPKKTKAVLVPLLYRIIGKKKLYRIIAQQEYDAEKKYEPVVEKFPQVESVKNDEHRHGDMVLGLLK